MAAVSPPSSPKRFAPLSSGGSAQGVRQPFQFSLTSVDGFRQPGRRVEKPDAGATVQLSLSSGKHFPYQCPKLRLLQLKTFRIS